MNIALWVAQILLAGLYAMAGGMKTFSTDKVKQMMPWAKDRSDFFVRFVGISELLGSVGLVLPALIQIFPWLTVLAAVGLAVIQLLAIFTEHLPKKEYKALPMNVLLLALATFVAIGRLVTP